MQYIGNKQIQAQTVALNQNMIQSLEVLQMDGIELSEYLEKLQLENPVIEITPVYYSASPTKHERNTTDDSYETDPLMLAASDDNTQGVEFFIADQIMRSDCSADIKQAALLLSKAIDSRGILAPEDIEYVRKQYHFSMRKADLAVRLIQSLEPAGIGGCNAEECLVLQLKRLPGNNSTEIKLLTEYTEMLAGRKLPQISKISGISMDRIQAALKKISSLSPFPFAEYNNSNIIYIVPDVYIRGNQEKYSLEFSNTYQPELSINPYYIQLLQETTDKQVRKYLKDKIHDAYTLAELMRKRKETFNNCVEYIVDRQHNYLFGISDSPLPMNQQDIADALDYHNSTISRALRNKYICCKRGIIEINGLFSRTATGGSCSTFEIKNIIKKLIEEENKSKPLSDQKISDIMSNEGLNIPRRTVAKYRDELGIASSANRKASK